MYLFIACNTHKNFPSRARIHSLLYETNATQKVAFANKNKLRKIINLILYY